MADATVKIPAEHAEAFYREAVDTLDYAAGNLKEAVEWFKEGTEPERLEREEIPRIRAAISLVESARNGDLEFGAVEFSADNVVRVTLEGLAIKAAERVKDCAEGVSAADTRRAMAELDLWMTLLESEPMEEALRARQEHLEAIRGERDREAVA